MTAGYFVTGGLGNFGGGSTSSTSTSTSSVLQAPDMLYSSIEEIKTMLEIDADDTSHDIRLQFFNEWATELIEEYLGRPHITLQERTEYLDGTGTEKLQLTHRPVYVSPTIAVNVDDNGHFAAPDDSFDSDTALTWGDDFYLDLDPAINTKSRSGILFRNGSVWKKAKVRDKGWLSPRVGGSYGTIKVVYTGGYTVDDLPATVRLACNLLIARLDKLFPLGMFPTSESYEERSISLSTPEKGFLWGEIRGILMPHRNWYFGGR